MRLAQFLSLYFICSNLAWADVRDTAVSNHLHKETLKILKLEDAKEEALKGNPSLSAANYGAKSQKANIEPAAALDDPVLGFELQDYPASGASLRSSTNAGNKITVRQKLPFPGKRTALRDEATKEYEFAEKAAQFKQVEVIKDLNISYYELTQLIRQDELYSKEKELIKSLLQLARTNFSLAKVPQSDVLTLQVEEANLLSKQIENKKDLEMKRAEINHLLGRDTNDNWIPEKLVSSKINISKFNIDDLISTATENNPMLQAEHSKLGASEARKKQAELGEYPDFEVMMGYTSMHSSGFDSGDDSVSVGVGITIPIWAATKQDKLIEKASFDRFKAEAEIKEGKNQIIHDIHSTVEALRGDEQRITLLKNALLPLTEAAIQSAQQSYLTSATSLSSLLTLIRSRFDAQRSYYEALVSKEKELATLEAVLGGNTLLGGE